MDATRIARDQLDVAIWRGRIDGRTYRDLGDELDVNHETIRRRFLRMLAESVPREEVADYRSVELARLESQRDQVQRLAGEVALPPKLKLAALRELRQISRSVALLLGLDVDRRRQPTSEGFTTGGLEAIFGKIEADLVRMEEAEANDGQSLPVTRDPSP